MDKRKRITGMICGIASSVLFGLSFIFTKAGLDGISVFTLLAWRFFIAVIAMTVLVAFRVIKLDLKGKSLWPLLLVALFQPIIYFITESYSIQLTTASESGTVLACIPILTLVLSTLILKEPPTKRQTVGICISVAGVILLGLIKGASASFNVLGYGLLLICSLSDSFYVVFTRKASGYSSGEKTYLMAILGFLVFTPIAFIEHSVNGTVTELLTLPLHNTDFLICILYLSLVSQIGAFLLCNYAIATVGPTLSASYVGVTTVVSVIGGVLFLGEPFSLVQGLATLLVIAGVYACNLIPRRAHKVEPVDVDSDEYRNRKAL